MPVKCQCGPHLGPRLHSMFNYFRRKTRGGGPILNAELRINVLEMFADSCRLDL